MLLAHACLQVLVWMLQLVAAKPALGSPVAVRAGFSCVPLPGTVVSPFCCATFFDYMFYIRMTLHEAHTHVRKRRPIIRPNVGFWRQLIQYEEALYGRRTVSMVDSNIGVIPDVYYEETKNMIWPSSSAQCR